MPSVLAVSTALTALIAAPLALVWAPTPSAERALGAGRAWSEVVASTQGAGVIHGAIDIAAPPKLVWRVMNDCQAAQRMIITLTSCKTLDGDIRQGWDVREQITRGNLFVPTIRNVVRNDYHPYTLIHFHRIGGDLKIEEGEWRLEPLSGGAGTRVIYVNRVAADVVAPAFLVRAGMKADTAKVLANLRRESLATAARGGG